MRGSKPVECARAARLYDAQQFTLRVDLADSVLRDYAAFSPAERMISPARSAWRSFDQMTRAAVGGGLSACVHRCHSGHPVRLSRERQKHALHVLCRLMPRHTNADRHA